MSETKAIKCHCREEIGDSTHCCYPDCQPKDTGMPDTNTEDMPSSPVDKTVDEMAADAREGKDLHYGGYREVAQALQSQLSQAKKDFDVMVGNDSRQEAAIETLRAERDAALKEVGDYKEALERYSNPEYINQYILHGSENKSWPSAAVSKYAQITLNKYKKEEQK